MEPLELAYDLGLGLSYDSHVCNPFGGTGAGRSGIVDAQTEKHLSYQWT